MKLQRLAVLAISNSPSDKFFPFLLKLKFIKFFLRIWWLLMLYKWKLKLLLMVFYIKVKYMGQEAKNG